MLQARTETAPRPQPKKRKQTVRGRHHPRTRLRFEPGWNQSAAPPESVSGAKGFFKWRKSRKVPELARPSPIYLMLNAVDAPFQVFVVDILNGYCCFDF